jgi:hypothetical protein
VTAKITAGFFIYTINNGQLSSTPTRITPSSSVLPFSMTFIGQNGLFFTDPGATGASIFFVNSKNAMKISNMVMFQEGKNIIR